MLSFIIPAHNEEDLLARTIRSIHDAARSGGLSYEVVVVDDASTDRTGVIGEREGARVVRIDRRQIAAARNAGATACAGDRLIFVDADTVVSTAALRGTLRAFDRGAAYGGAAIRWDGRIPAWTSLLLRVMLIGYELGGVASGAYLFVTREAFESAGGFDETLFAAEEVDLCVRLRRVGKHAWVRAPVVTSGRKLRTYPAREMLKEIIRLGAGGRRGLTSREGLDIWYAPRRPDPAGVPHVPSD